MMSPDDRALEDLLYNSDLGDEAEGAEPGGSPPGLQESAAADTVSMMVPHFTALLLLLFGAWSPCVTCCSIQPMLIQQGEVEALRFDWSDVLQCLSLPV